MEDPLQLFPRMLNKLYSLWVSRTYPFAFMGGGVLIHHTFKASRAMAPRMKLGNSVSLGKDVWLNVIPEATDEVNIIIDDNCRVGPRTWISAKNQIHLERDVCLAPSVLIQDHGHAYDKIDLPIRKQTAMEGGRIRIESGCRIGQGVAIVCSRGELVLGQHCVVMPNSVVIRSAPAYSILGGNPARVIEQFDPSKMSPNAVYCSTKEMNLKEGSLVSLTSGVPPSIGRSE